MELIGFAIFVLIVVIAADIAINDGDAISNIISSFRNKK